MALTTSAAAEGASVRGPGCGAGVRGRFRGLFFFVVLGFNFFFVTFVFVSFGLWGFCFCLVFPLFPLGDGFLFMTGWVQVGINAGARVPANSLSRSTDATVPWRMPARLDAQVEIEDQAAA